MFQRSIRLCLAVLAAFLAQTARGELHSGKGLRRASAATTGARHALVIGNQAYHRQPLDNPRRDAEAVAGKLRALGFDVTALADATNEQLGRAVDSYVTRLHAGDLSFVYYSGHGVQVDNGNYLVPVDFEGNDESDLKYRAYPLDLLMDKLGKGTLGLSVLVLDACRDNPFRGAKGGARGLAQVSAGEGTLIAFATAPGKTADDGRAGSNGVYTASLLKYLDTASVDIREVFFKVQEDVVASTDGAQWPWISSSVVGHFFLKATAQGATEPAPPPTPPPAAVTAAAPEPPPVVATRHQPPSGDQSQQQLAVNGVLIGLLNLRVEGLEGVTLQKCGRVQFEANGDVNIDCPGYDLRSAGGTPSTSRHEGRHLLFVNGTPIGDFEMRVAGLEGVLFEKCASVAVQSNGSVDVDCPGYDLRAATGGAQPVAAAATTSTESRHISKKYWIVASQTKPGATKFDIDFYLNGQWIHRFRNNDDTAVVEISKHVAPGNNKVIFAATKMGGTLNGADAVYKFIVGDGEVVGSNLRLDHVAITYQKTGADIDATTDERVLTAE